MQNLTTDNSNLVYTITFIFIVFICLSVILLTFFYFSRKKILQKEIEKKNLEINHQKDLLRSVIITQEDERKRIAQDLHDDISSKLNIVSLNSHLLKTPNLARAEFIDITDNIILLTKNALENSRRIAHDLLPPVLEKFGIHAGIEELIVEVSSTKMVTIDYVNKLVFNSNETEKHLHIFRILQELINNSLRHGKATKINITFDLINNKETCCYKDNGIGFNFKNKSNKKGLGIKNIESRVAFLNGELTIKSELNNGFDAQFNF